MITVLYGGSSSLSTPLAIRNLVPTITDPFSVQAPVGFSPGDVIVATQATPTPHCTLSTVTAVSGLPNLYGEATISQTPFPGSQSASYNKTGNVVNLGRATSMGRIAYTVDPATLTLRTQNQLHANGPVSPNPVISDVVNLKARYGLDTDNDGIVETWQKATEGVWTAAVLPNQPLATLRQIRAVRIAIVTRSAQYEKDAVTTKSLFMFADTDDPVEMKVTDIDPHYRYKVLETIVPLRNALWNAP
jgi:type IV pilus assembly protein PilW